MTTTRVIEVGVPGPPGVGGGGLTLVDIPISTDETDWYDAEGQEGKFQFNGDGTVSTLDATDHSGKIYLDLPDSIAGATIACDLTFSVTGFDDPDTECGLFIESANFNDLIGIDVTTSTTSIFNGFASHGDVAVGGAHLYRVRVQGGGVGWIDGDPVTQFGAGDREFDWKPRLALQCFGTGGVTVDLSACVLRVADIS